MTWSSNSHTRSVPYKLQQACFKRDHYTCTQCGYQGTPNKGDLHADHIINRAQGGEHTLDNLRTLCVPCHEPHTRRQWTASRARGKREPPPHPSDYA